MKWLRIHVLRRRGRRQYREYQRILSEWSCGATLAEHLCEPLSRVRMALNETLGELERIDPSFPGGDGHERLD